jgi:hypothetical protein
MSPDNPPGAPACSLSPDRFLARKALIDGLLRRGLEHITPLRNGVRARFVSGAEIESKIETLVKLEAECCAFLSMALHTSDDALVLEVTGPPEVRQLITDLFTDRTGAEG